MQKRQKWYRNPYVWLGTGCGCIVLFPFLLLALMLAAWAYKDIPRYGEHLPKAEKYSPQATDYSYYNRLLHQACEFDIPENAFLEMCQIKKWHPVPIETLSELPKVETQDEYPWINFRRRVPLEISRYVRWYKPGHEECYPFHGDCKVDPSGKTDASCFRSVSQGYYYEIIWSNGGGITVIYDSENGRCYIHSSPW